MHLTKKIIHFCVKLTILINIIIKSIFRNIFYLSVRYDTGISFMIPIQYDTFDTLYISTSKTG